MKHFGLVVLAGVGLIQGGSATCCRTNKCLKAIVNAGPAGLADCAEKLTVTVTGPAVPIQTTVTVTGTAAPVQTTVTGTALSAQTTVTGTAVTIQTTVTVVDSDVATSLYTETTTDTASTQTLLYTESTTTTASTQTDVATTTTTTTVPSTHTSLAAAVTTTKTVYEQGVTARSLQTNVPEVPRYASGACKANFARYVKACACAGVEVVTVTAEPSVVEVVTVTAQPSVTEVVTVTAEPSVTEVVTVTVEPPATTVTIEASTVTSIYSTYSSTETTTDLATTTTSTTLISIVSVTDTVTSTATEVASSTTVLSVTSTPPTTIVTLRCKPPGSIFHATVVQNDDGITRFLNNPGNYPVWQYGFQPTNPAMGLAFVNSNSWRIGSNGYLESAYPPAGSTEIAIPYIPLSSQSNSYEVITMPKSVVDAAVAAGTSARISACINAATNELTMSVEGKHRIFNCGNSLILSDRNAAEDLEYPDSYCTELSPTALARTLFL